MSNAILNLEDFPEDPFALKGKLFSFGIEERIAESISFIDTYQSKEKLYHCNEFMAYVYLDCFRGDGREWQKHGGFPRIETTFQFDHSIKLALSGMYKSAFEYLRSCLELTIVSIYYALDKNVLEGERILTATIEEIKKTLEDEQKWFNSMEGTPRFPAMLKLIGKDNRFKTFDERYGWFAELKNIYYSLSDYTHIKGYKKGTQYLNDPRTHISSSSLHSVNMKTFKIYLDVLINTVEQITILISLYNPVVLAELPLEEKFGINEPVGFIHPGQSELIHQILPANYRNYFLNLVQTDDEVLGNIAWVNSRPSLTIEDMKQQVKEFNELFAEKTENGKNDLDKNNKDSTV